MQFELQSEAQKETSKGLGDERQSGLDLLSVSELKTGASNQKQSPDISILTDTAHKILRDHAELANDKVRYFPKSLSPDVLDLNNPFDKCAPEAEAQDAQGNPEETAKRAIDKLKSEIERNENSPEEKGKWQHGANLHDLAEYEMYLGKYADANKHLRQSIEILRKELPNQPDKEQAEKAFMQASFDYGTSLVRPKGGIEDKQQVIRDRQEADKVFAETLTLAQKYAVSPIQQADLVREKLANLTALAARHDVKTADGKAAYRQEMQNIIDTYNKSLVGLQNEKSNDGIASRALTTGDLAFAESKRADAIGDKDAVNSVQHYEDTLKLWKEYNPKKDATSDAQVQTRQDSVDKTLLVLLPQYYQLLKATSNNARADEIKKQYEEVIARHPDIRIKNN